VHKSQIIIDPASIGKSFEQNYELLRAGGTLQSSVIHCWLARRGGILGATLAREGKSAPPDERLWAPLQRLPPAFWGSAYRAGCTTVAEMAQLRWIATAC